MSLKATTAPPSAAAISSSRGSQRPDMPSCVWHWSGASFVALAAGSFELEWAQMGLPITHTRYSMLHTLLPKRISLATAPRRLWHLRPCSNSTQPQRAEAGEGGMQQGTGFIDRKDFSDVR